MTGGEQFSYDRCIYIRTKKITFRADKKAERRNAKCDKIADRYRGGGAKRRSMRPLVAAAATRVDASSTSAASVYSCSAC